MDFGPKHQGLDKFIKYKEISDSKAPNLSFSQVLVVSDVTVVSSGSSREFVKTPWIFRGGITDATALVTTISLRNVVGRDKVGSWVEAGACHIEIDGVVLQGVLYLESKSTEVHHKL